MSQVEVYEPVQLIVDNLVLQGLEANLVSTNAVSKSYVDNHISSAVCALVASAPGTLNTLTRSRLLLVMMQTSQTPSSEANTRALADADLQTQINAFSVATGGSGGISIYTHIYIYIYILHVHDLYIDI